MPAPSSFFGRSVPTTFDEVTGGLRVCHVASREFSTVRSDYLTSAIRLFDQCNPIICALAEPATHGNMGDLLSEVLSGQFRRMRDTDRFVTRHWQRIHRNVADIVALVHHFGNETFSSTRTFLPHIAWSVCIIFLTVVHWLGQLRELCTRGALLSKVLSTPDLYETLPSVVREPEIAHTFGALSTASLFLRFESRKCFRVYVV